MKKYFYLEFIKARSLPSFIILYFILTSPRSEFLSLVLGNELVLNSENILAALFHNRNLIADVLTGVAVLCAYSVSQENGEQSLQLQIVNGYTRKQYFLGKLFFYSSVGYCLFALYFVILLFSMFFKHAFFSFNWLFEIKANYLFGMLLLPIVFSCLGIMMGKLFKRPILAIGLLLMFLSLEWIIVFLDVFYFETSLSAFLPFKLIFNHEPSGISIGLRFLYCAAILFFSTYTFFKIDFR